MRGGACDERDEPGRREDRDERGGRARRGLPHAARLRAAGRRRRSGRGPGWCGAAAFRLRAGGRRAARRHEDRRARLRFPEPRDGKRGGTGGGRGPRVGRTAQGRCERPGDRGRERDHARGDAGQRHPGRNARHLHHHRRAQEDLRLLAALLHRPHRRARAEEVGHYRSFGPRRQDCGRGAVGHHQGQAGGRCCRGGHRAEVRRVRHLSRDQDRARGRARGCFLRGQLHPSGIPGRRHLPLADAVRAPGIRRGHEEGRRIFQAHRRRHRGHGGRRYLAGVEGALGSVAGNRGRCGSRAERRRHGPGGGRSGRRWGVRSHRGAR